MAQNHSPWFSQLSPCLSPSPRTQVRSGKERRQVSLSTVGSTGQSKFQIWDPGTLAHVHNGGNIRLETIISGSRKWVKLPLLIQLTWEGQQEGKEAYRPKVSLWPEAACSTEKGLKLTVPQIPFLWEPEAQHPNILLFIKPTKLMFEYALCVLHTVDMAINRPVPALMEFTSPER